MTIITDLHTSLLREKFIIHDPDIYSSEIGPITALSNRIVVPLKKSNEKTSEDYVIRAQNMHSCIRMASRIIHNYNIGGSFLGRAKPYDWEATYEGMLNDYERLYNDEKWVAIYHKGKLIFKSGDHHPLLDLIEKCEEENTKEYDYSIPMAENAFKAAGKVVKLDYDANVALNLTFEDNIGRCGIILRGADRTTTFNFKVSPKGREPINIPQCLSSAAGFLEGIQLAFLLGFNVFKLNVGIFERGSRDEKQTKDGQRRLGQLNAEIANLESQADINYRPEKPDFYRIVAESEELASKVIDIPEKEKKPFGADNSATNSDTEHDN